jgi:hypothetical protein
VPRIRPHGPVHTRSHSLHTGSGSRPVTVAQQRPARTAHLARAAQLARDGGHRGVRWHARRRLFRLTAEGTVRLRRERRWRQTLWWGPLTPTLALDNRRRAVADAGSSAMAAARRRGRGVRWCGSWAPLDLGAAPNRGGRRGGSPGEAVPDGPVVAADDSVEKRRPGHQKGRRRCQWGAPWLRAALRGTREQGAALFTTSGEKLKCGRLVATPEMRLGGGAPGS